MPSEQNDVKADTELEGIRVVVRKDETCSVVYFNRFGKEAETVDGLTPFQAVSVERMALREWYNGAEYALQRVRDAIPFTVPHPRHKPPPPY